MSLPSRFGGGRTSKILGRCCHESVQNLLVLPLHISQKLCYCISALCCFAALQIRKLISVLVILISSSGGRLFTYFVVHSLAHGVCGLDTQRHHNLAPINVLLCWGSHSPKPPYFFSMQTVAHFTSAHLQFCPEEPQRKLPCMSLIFLSTHFGTASTEKK